MWKWGTELHRNCILDAMLVSEFIFRAFLGRIWDPHGSERVLHGSEGVEMEVRGFHMEVRGFSHGKEALCWPQKLFSGRFWAASGTNMEVSGFCMEVRGLKWK